MPAKAMSAKDILSKEELAALTQRSDLRGAFTVACNYALIAGSFVLVALVPSILTVLLALVVLGGRQLGLGILMHDCAHNTLFKSRALNQWVGRWLCAAPVLVDLDRYRTYHLKHHKLAGTLDDPDYPNYRNYPVTTKSFLRKVWRDLNGSTGIRNFLVTLKMHSGEISYELVYKGAELNALAAAEKRRNLIDNLKAPLIVNAVLLLILALFGVPYLYLVWVVAYLTTYQLFSRIRNAAEHATTPAPLDTNPLMHTRTTYANPLARLTVAPNYVNYHLEHHLLLSVPPHKLKSLHGILRARGALQGADIAPGYWNVIRQLTGVPPRAKAA
jgi:fatty acid desaturase